MVKKQCIVCGVWFYVKKSEADRRRCCGRRCKDYRQGQLLKGYNSPLAKPKTKKNCVTCSSEFRVIPALAEKRKFCSRECYYASKKNKKEFQGNDNPNWRGGISNRTRPYMSDKLKEEIRMRDNNVCQNCNKPQLELSHTIEVHHIDYNEANNSYDNLISLCKSCHAKTGFSRDDWKNYFRNKVIIQ